MASDDFLAFVQSVGGWEGFEIARWTTEEALEPDAFGLPAKRLVIELEPAADAVKRCSRCGSPVPRSTMSPSGACATCRFWALISGWSFRSGGTGAARAERPARDQSPEAAGRARAAR